MTDQQLTITDDFAKQLISGIAESRASTVLSTGGYDLLRMLKSGEWVFGQGDEPVQEGSRWLVNVFAIQHGWCCWVESEGSGANKLAGEVLVPIGHPKPPRPLPIEGSPFVELRTFVLACLDGDDAGHNVMYKVQSLGGMKAVDGLLQDVQRQLAVDKDHACPVLRLGNSYYEHKKWGRVYTPVLTRVGWADVNGLEAGTTQAPAVAAATPAPSPEPVRIRKAPLTAAAPVAPPPQPAPVQPTAAARAGQRRRPAAS